MSIESDLKDAIDKSELGRPDQPSPPTRYAPPRHRNNGPPATVDHAQAVEAGLHGLRAVLEERDRLELELKAARLKIAELETRLATHDTDFNTIQSRVQSCILERDRAVQEAGELRGLLRAVAAIVVESDVVLDEPAKP